MIWFPSSLIALVASSMIPVTLAGGTIPIQEVHIQTRNSGQTAKITPKVFIFSMFDSERDAWFNIPEFNILGQNITVPGFSPLFPQAHCTEDGSICELVTGEAEINAAATVSSLIHSSVFDLKETYFLIAGIAGASPKLATTGSVTLARFAVQVALQYEIDAREIPSNYPTGYIPQGVTPPNVFEYPPELYGTEVFEVNENLRQLAFGFAKTAQLNDTADAQSYRANYANVTAFAAGAGLPSVVLCDTATSDNYWIGTLLAEAFENTTTLFTNGTGVYCTTQQEDNGTLEILMRDFDRPFSGQTAAECLFADHGGFEVSLNNIHIAGVKIIQGIIDDWDKKFKAGVQPDNYIGDVFGSLGGQPDFGPGSLFNGHQARSLSSKKGGRRVRRK